MPKVPASSGNVVPFSPKPPEEVYFAMAAAQMDSFGRLFEKEPTTLEQVLGQTKLKQSASGIDGEMYAHKMFRQGEEARDISADVPRGGR